MNSVLGWAKTNWLIIVFVVVMIASLVAGYIGSDMWGSSLRQDFQTRVGQRLQQVQGARVSYSIPPLAAGEQSVGDSGPPNAEKTRWFRERIESRVAQAAALVREAEQFNQGINQAESNRIGHRPSLPGIFPAPRRERIPNIFLDFRDMVNGARGQPSMVAALLNRYGAGPAANLRRVEAVLADVRDREVEAIVTETGAQPTAEAMERITRMLSERRVQEYQRAARDFSMYATDAAIAITPMPAQGTPTLEDCFRWQWDYWIASDIMAALSMANTDDVGLRTEVDRSVVKRIEAIRVEPLRLPRQSEDPFGGGNPTEQVTPPATITGRPGDSQDYDVRYVTLDVIVASERLPELFNALAATNFFTVVDMNLRQVDGWQDLRAGYYYGSDNVIRASLKIETVWLRSWTGPLMPESVRQPLGVIVPEAAPEGAAGSDTGGN
ncbi:MAG: hypothetical protein R3B68_14370 [Phycisphaerales bacterium]